MTPLASDIERKTVTATVSAYPGGFLDSDTSGQVIASFLDVSGNELGKVETAPYDTKQLPRGSTGLVLWSQLRSAKIVIVRASWHFQNWTEEPDSP